VGGVGSLSMLRGTGGGEDGRWEEENIGQGLDKYR
jgi:hypothetical protein